MDELASPVKSDGGSIFRSREGKRKGKDKLTDICRENETKIQSYFLNSMIDINQLSIITQACRVSIVNAFYALLETMKTRFGCLIGCTKMGQTNLKANVFQRGLCSRI